MSKYIRTKGNTFIEFNYSNERVIDGNKYIMFIRILNDGSEEKYCVPERYIATQADTIEELCDEFVDIDNRDYYKISHKNGITYALSKTKRFIGHCDIRLKYIGQIMGAIYTDKGLIYVAKMNDKGELELL